MSAMRGYGGTKKEKHDVGDGDQAASLVQIKRTRPWLRWRKEMGRTIAILVGRLIFGAMFLMATSFKFFDMHATADFIAAAGFPIPLLLAWVAAFFELALALAFLTGAFFSQAAVLAGIYVIFLAFSFHGPGKWATNQDEFGFFVDHFTFLAGLLFATVHGPGDTLVARPALLKRSMA
jgi:uncharacterized membrane protein YphA (DoxX/SURF4 family)